MGSTFSVKTNEGRVVVSESVIRKRITESRGFSLLEIIFVLAFLGIILGAVLDKV